MLLAVAAEVAWSSPVDFSSEDSRLHDAIRSEVGLGRHRCRRNRRLLFAASGVDDTFDNPALQSIQWRHNDNVVLGGGVRHVGKLVVCALHLNHWTNSICRKHEGTLSPLIAGFLLLMFLWARSPCYRGNALNPALAMSR